MQGTTRSCLPCQSHQLHLNHHYGNRCRHHRSFQIDMLIWGPSTLKPPLPLKRDKRSPKRAIPRFPERILDAPGLLKDPLTSPISWCHSRSILAVALNCSVYLWEEKSASICSHFTFGSAISAVHWITSSIVAIGSADGVLILWEPLSHSQIYLKRSKGAPINIITNGPCGTIVTGDSKGDLFFFFPNGSSLAKPNAHSHQISFITFEQKGLFATMDSSGLVHLWKIVDSTAFSPVIYGSILKYASHSLSAIKAVGWCPWRSSLVAVAGPSSITLWNAYSGSLISEATFLDHAHPPLTLYWWYPESSMPLIVVVHSNYEISLWSLPRLFCITRIRPEIDSVVLHACWTGSRIISIAADERIQFHSLSPQSAALNSPSKLNSPLKAGNITTSPTKELSLHTIPISPYCKEMRDVNTSPASLKNKNLSIEYSFPSTHAGCGGLFSPESRRLLFGVNDHRHPTA